MIHANSELSKIAVDFKLFNKKEIKKKSSIEIQQSLLKFKESQQNLKDLNNLEYSHILWYYSHGDEKDVKVIELEKDTVTQTRFQSFINENKERQLRKYKKILDQSKGQIIFYGPPGTGKTYIAKQLANKITKVDLDGWKASTHRKIVQFHPSYSYEDFVQGIKPVSEPPNINYKLQPGTFQKFCENLNISKTSPTSAPQSMQDKIALVLLREEAVGGNSLTVNQIHDRLKNGYTAHKYDSLHVFTGQTQYQYGVVNHRCHDFWEHGNPSRPADEENWWFEHTKGTGDWCMNKNCASYDDLKQKFESLEQVQEDTNTRVLIIDEINRGNLSKIFGELIYGLEYRDEEIDLQYKQIPNEIFDKKAVDKGEVRFYDVSYIEVKPIIKGNTLSIELLDFATFYNLDNSKKIEETLKNKTSNTIVSGGKIIKISKDKNGIINRELLTKKWSDWVDYWSVDFDFQNRKEIIRVKPEGSEEWEEKWTGDYIFDNEWQSFRSKSNRDLEFITTPIETNRSKTKVAIKVIDIFGNDTMKIIDVIMK